MRPPRSSGQRGQGLIEFAVMFPLILFFLFAIFDVGLALDRRATLQHAVREGARYGSLVSDPSNAGLQPVRNRTSSQAQGLVPAVAPPGPNQPGVDICYEDINNDGVIGPGDAIDVVTFYTYKPAILRTALSLFGSGIADIKVRPTGSARLEVALTGPAPLC